MDSDPSSKQIYRGEALTSGTPPSGAGAGATEEAINSPPPLPSSPSFPPLPSGHHMASDTRMCNNCTGRHADMQHTAVTVELSLFTVTYVDVDPPCTQTTNTHCCHATGEGWIRRSGKKCLRNLWHHFNWKYLNESLYVLTTLNNDSIFWLFLLVFGLYTLFGVICWRFSPIKVYFSTLHVIWLAIEVI